MKKRLLLFALLLCAGAATQAAFAQAPPSGGPQPANPNAANVTPIDGGASLLLASGVAYSIKRLRNRRRA